jgi:hypothetical protein
LNDNEKIEHLYDLARMAWADGVLDDTEIESMRAACKRLGFAEEHVVAISEFLLEQACENKNIGDVLKTIENL